MTTSRVQIRQDVLTHLGDGFVATASVAGTTTAFTDANTLVLPANEYKGRTIWFSGGTAANLEQSRKINGSTGSTVQWGVALPADTAQGDEAEFWNHRGTGWEPQEINRLISIAHRELTEHLPIDMESDEFVWDADSPSLNIPEAMIAVTGVQWQEESDTANWRNVPRAQRRNAPGYWVDRANRTLIIDGAYRYHLDVRTVTILGYRRESALDEDSSTTATNREALVARVCELACAALLLRSPEPGLIRDKLQMYQRDAQYKRTLAIPRRAANVDRVD